jgi:hypothetical protein
MDHFARVQFDDEKGEQRAKEEVCDLQEVTRPHIFRMVLQEGGPGLSSPPWCASMPHIFLNGSFRDVHAQLQQLTTNTFSSPEPILRLCWLLWASVRNNRHGVLD